MTKQHSPRFTQLAEEARQRIRECTVEEVRRRIEAGERFVLIDVREESEYASGHAVGAIHLSKGVIERDIESKCPDPNTPIVLYCGGGYRSALAADNLQKMGYTQVVSLAGGWRAWLQAGLPIEHGTAPSSNPS
jgi:rhodanese-related sulfurtransferase